MKDKTTSQLIQEAQPIFNTWIKLRDKGLPCISCGAPHPTDAGHLFKVSTHPEMRFNPMGCHSQCRACNSLDDGNFEAYCDGIVARYGREYLQKVIQESIRLRQSNFKWSKSDLKEMIIYYKKEIKRLKC